MTARLLLPLALVATLAACSAGRSDPGGEPPATSTFTPPPAASAGDPTVAPTAPPSGDPAPAPTDAPTDAPTPGVTLDQAWATAELTDVATGETFRIADFAGRPIILETMAIWCSSCLAQQGTVHEVLAERPAGAVEYVLVDIDPNESAADLAAYRERHGFTGRYVVASSELARAIVADFGDRMLSAPSTPIVLIGSDGTVTLTPFGMKSADDLRTLLDQHGG